MNSNLKSLKDEGVEIIKYEHKTNQNKSNQTKSQAHNSFNDKMACDL